MSNKKFCHKCNSWWAKTQFYDHLPCNASNPDVLNTDSRSRSNGRFFCQHCRRIVSKSTFYEHRALYGNFFREEEADVFDIGGDNPKTPDGGDGEHEKEFDGDCLEDGEEDEECSDKSMFGSQEEESGNETSSSNMDESSSEEFVEDNPEGMEEQDGFISGSTETHENDPSFETSSPQPAASSSESRTLLMFLLIWQTLYKVSDKAVLILLKFIKGFLQYLAEICELHTLKVFASTIPETLYMIRKSLCMDKDEFDKYAVCPKCHSLYPMEDCLITKANGIKVSAKCSNVVHPRHPHKTWRKPCGTILMKLRKSNCGTNYYYPKKMYCYKKVTESLQDLIKKSNFLNDCELWRERSSLNSDILGDVYEGNIWKDFQNVNGEPFLAASNNFGFMLNVDWFQPTKHGLHSIGVIYLVVMNLPREQRFKPENTIVVGIIPGPKEPKLHINTYLQPLVDELIDLWDGVLLDSGGGIFEKYRAALLALSSDIPATRKCGGFLGHCANRGCNKCHKEFPRSKFGAKPDYSGFVRSEWEDRTNQQCRMYAEMYQEASLRTKSEAKSQASRTGIRYSVLYQLPYYDAVRFTLIDPMHNLLLGTAKHVLNTWVNEGIIDSKDLIKLQDRVNKIKPPSDIGRLPNKVANGFSGFTADQWKNWICIYSLFALKGVVPNKHYYVWADFVHACQILCSKVITKENCMVADQKLMTFCQNFEKLYGKDKCTPNMHLHGHLMQCIFDYGPIYSFWCFSFERYNGLLGDYHTNNTNIGLQIMRKFLRDKFVLTAELPLEMSHLSDVLASSIKQRGTLLEMSTRSDVYSDLINLELDNLSEVNFCKTSAQVPLAPFKRKALDSIEIDNLKEIYEFMYDTNTVRHVSNFYQSFKSLYYAGYYYQADRTNDSNASVVNAKWLDESKRPAVIRGFMMHDIVLEKQNGKAQKITHILADVEWYAKYHGNNIYSSPVEIWSSQFESYSSFSYVPVGRIQQKCVAVKATFKGSNNVRNNISIIIPLPSAISL